jgi:photosystem II stability/assembly factor-like uncharacterized protein
MIDPRDPNRVLVATDLRGVLASNDGFAHYTSSNQGFSHRVVRAVVLDRKDPSRLYVGVANDKEQGGMFLSDDAGKNWRQSSRGLAGRDILSLQQAENGTLFAGTNHGIFQLASVSGSWQPMKMIWGSVPEGQPAPSEPGPSKSAAAGKRKTAAPAPKAPAEPVIALATAPRVRSLQMGEKAWFAATDEGLFLSVDQGQKWYGQTVEGNREFSVVNCYENGVVTLAGVKGAYLSRDDGKTWTPVTLPKYVSGVHNLTLTPGPTLWLGTQQGALRSTDGGQTWQYMLGGLPKDDVLGVEYDAAGQRLLATALHSHAVFESKDGGKSWQSTPDAGVSIRAALNYKGHLLAASFYNGLLLGASD